MRDNASQMIYCNFTKSRAAEDMIKSFTLLWNLNSTWRVFDNARPDPLNPRYIRMDPETGYRLNTMLRFMADHGYQIKLTPPRDKHARGIAERMVGIVMAKTNNAMLENGAPPSCDKQRYYLDLTKSRGRIGSIASQQCLYQLSILCN